MKVKIKKHLINFYFYFFQKNPWITKNGEFPLPDIHEEALEYVYSLTTQEIQEIRNDDTIIYGENNNSKDEVSP